MRWGVRDEATDDHMTTELCMKEIENCQRLSMGPNFVVKKKWKLIYQIIAYVPGTLASTYLQCKVYNLDYELRPKKLYYIMYQYIIIRYYLLLRNKSSVKGELQMCFVGIWN